MNFTKFQFDTKQQNYVISVQKVKSTTWRHKLEASIKKVSWYKYDRWGAMSRPSERPVILGQAVFPWGSTWELLARYRPPSRLKNLIGCWHLRKLVINKRDGKNQFFVENNHIRKRVFLVGLFVCFVCLGFFFWRILILNNNTLLVLFRV